jgi:hypothetical protein
VHIHPYQKGPKKFWGNGEKKNKNETIPLKNLK